MTAFDTLTQAIQSAQNGGDYDASATNQAISELKVSSAA